MACCEACKKAQDAGTMPRGATCSPCGGTFAFTTAESSPVIGESECPTLILPRVDALATQLWEASRTDLEGITLEILSKVYPQTPDGRPIDWTAQTIDTATCLLELRRRVRVRVAYVFAHHDEDVASRRWASVRGGA